MANPVVYSGFFSKNLQAWLDDVDLPQEARMMLQSMGETTTRHNVLYYDTWQAELSTNKTYSDLAGSLSSLRVIIAQIEGDGAVRVVGKDFDGTTDITADLRGMGNEKFPGRVVYMGYNVSSIVLVPREAGTVFQVKHLVICEDDDPLYS